MSLLHALKKKCLIYKYAVCAWLYFILNREGKSNFLPCSSMSYSFCRESFILPATEKEDFLKYINGTQNPSMKSYSFTTIVFPFILNFCPFS